MTKAEAEAEAAPTAKRLVVITGMSGAGRTTALKVLEDCGYEAVDNLPLSLLERILQPGRKTPPRPMAIAMDTRTRGFDSDACLRQIDRLRDRGEVDVMLVFFDCDDEVLARRFTETRRRHPMADDRPVNDGIARERQVLSRLARNADMRIDTSLLSVRDLGQLLRSRFTLPATPTMAITVTSFSYRHGLPREADLVFDARFLRNPHYQEELREGTGRDAAVGAYIRDDDEFAPFLAGLGALLGRLLPRYQSEGKSYLTIAVGCTGGRHRSVFVAEQLTALLRDLGNRVLLLHRDIEVE